MVNTVDLQGDRENDRSNPCQGLGQYARQYVCTYAKQYMAVRMPGSTWQYVARQYVCQAGHGSTYARQYMAVRMPGSTWQYVARQYMAVRC